MTLRMILTRCLLLSWCALPSYAAQKRTVTIDGQGRYRIGEAGRTQAAICGQVAAQVDGRWLHADEYPKHDMRTESVQGALGEATQWQVTFSGLQQEPDLMYVLRAYHDAPAVDLQVSVVNSGNALHDGSDIRAVDALDISLGGPAWQDRVLSDSSSEDRPAMTIRDLADAPEGMHRGVGSQLIYNRSSRQSLFLGALDSAKFLTVLRLKVTGNHEKDVRITGFEADSTGTTEVQEHESLQDSPSSDRVQLKLPLRPGQSLSSEPLLIDLDNDYHRQLESYGALIRKLHAARTQAPPLFGWWSWTAYYAGLNEGAALTNAQWLSEHLRKFGYDVFHIDESYQYARGEYATPDASHFPHGIRQLEDKVRALGLVPGIWTAPFEVSDRSWVYQNHPEWLVKNAAANPIHIGTVESDHLFVLDTTNPGAQEYLRNTYSKLVHDWGIRYIKMDFMDDTAVEGVYYLPNTTALEAERVGLKIIRDTVGEHVLLDKDGSPMLNAVGFVDYGRISQDTGHTFEASRDAATGIAARYYMNRNFFVSDPDAFSVSRQTIADQPFHGKVPLTMDEARVSLALAAVSGGMLEIGDSLPAFEGAPDRLALLENEDVLNMVRLGRAATPIDLLDYRPQDRQPSIFLLRESPRQSILSVFNWTDDKTTQTIGLSRIGLHDHAAIRISDIFDQQSLQASGGAIQLELPAHSVRMLKVQTPETPELPLTVAISAADTASSGASETLQAKVSGDDPALNYEWSFGDGVQETGEQTEHAWVAPGDYTVQLRVTSLSGDRREVTRLVHISGHMPTRFAPSENKRYSGQ